MVEHDMYTQVELLKKEVQYMKGIYRRIDTDIERITEVSTSVNRMLAVHEEKISQQELDYTNSFIDYFVQFS